MEILWNFLLLHATISDLLDIELIVGHGCIAIDVSHFDDQRGRVVNIWSRFLEEKKEGVSEISFVECFQKCIAALWSSLTCFDYFASFGGIINLCASGLNALAIINRLGAYRNAFQVKHSLFIAHVSKHEVISWCHVNGTCWIIVLGWWVVWSGLSIVVALSNWFLSSFHPQFDWLGRFHCQASLSDRMA